MASTGVGAVATAVPAPSLAAEAGAWVAAGGDCPAHVAETESGAAGTAESRAWVAAGEDCEAPDAGAVAGTAGAEFAAAVESAVTWLAERGLGGFCVGAPVAATVAVVGGAVVLATVGAWLAAAMGDGVAAVGDWTAPVGAWVAAAAAGVAPGKAGVAADEAGVVAGEAGVAADEAGVAAGEAGVAADEAGVAAGEAGVAADEAGVAADEAGVAAVAAGAETVLVAAADAWVAVVGAVMAAGVGLGVATRFKLLPPLGEESFAAAGIAFWSPSPRALTREPAPAAVLDDGELDFEARGPVAGAGVTALDSAV